LRKQASKARTRMSVTESKREKNAAGNAKEQTDDPEAPFLGQRRNSGYRDRDLKHGYPAREDFVLMKIRFRLRLFVLGLGFDIFLLFFITIALGGVRFAGRGRECNFRIEHRSLDALGLIVTPLVG